MDRDDPVSAMIGTAKVFWKQVSVAPQGDGFGILLDARQLRTPAKSALIVPTSQLATEIATEWQALGDRVDPDKLPFTRMANAAIDKVALQKSEVANLLAAYGDADMLCYRAATPAALVARQTECWDPILDWAAAALRRTGPRYRNCPAGFTAFRVLNWRRFTILSACPVRLFWRLPRHVPGTRRKPCGPGRESMKPGRLSNGARTTKQVPQS